MAEKTGWLEKWHKGSVVSILEVKYHRVKVKKGPKKKGKTTKAHTFRDSELYYMLDKKVNLGQLTLTGNSVFSKNEIVEVELPLTKYNTRMRLLGKILKTTTFMELKRVVFRGDVHFAAVNKEDFDLVVSMEQKGQVAPAPRSSAPPSKPGQKDDKFKVTFKRS